MSKFTPLADRVLVAQPDYPDEETVGGIIITRQHAKEQHEWCKVLAVGKDVKAISIGDTVLVDRYVDTTDRVKLDGKDCFITREKFIYGKL